MRSLSWLPLFCVLLATAHLVGCVEDRGGTAIRGKVTYDGDPVPFGDIVFTPDGSKGNSGRQGFATISNGFYDTSQGKRGRGVAGGPTRLRVAGFNEDGGKGLIFETELRLDLPVVGGEFDIEIPKSKAAESRRNEAVPEI